jgi:hypothetical protein
MKIETNFSIPFSFINGILPLNWEEIYWGYERHFLGWKDIFDFSEQKLSTSVEDKNAEEENELCWIGKDEIYKIEELVKKLATKDQAENKAVIEKKWLFLCLKWLYENRNSFEDPLGYVEQIYADFDYPPEIEDFVRYMPVTNGYEPSKHSKVENENRLLNLWVGFLKKTETELTEK